MTASSVPPAPAFDARQHLAGLLRAALASVAPSHGAVDIVLERPKQASHGDFASNLAMQLARELKTNPRQVAERLVRELPPSPHVVRAEVAGAGFINFTLAPAARTAVVAAVLAAGGDFGRGPARNGRMARRLQVEFVSANPTGPLHVGHGRGAAYGASLASLLAFAGYEVTREYYVNDAGRQMDILAVSAWLRYLALFDEPLPFPPNAYQGGYVHEMAEQIKQAHGDRYVHPAEAVLACVPDTDDDEARLDALILAGKDLLGEDWAYVHGHVLSEQLADCRADLEEFGVHFDVWFSERSLYDTGMVARAVEKLEKAGHIYLQDGAKWFQSTAFGDEKDRVVQRDNGLYTYFASDIAYHLNKFERGFDKVIDVWGADHHGYIPRVKGALPARAPTPTGSTCPGAVRQPVPRRAEGLDVHPLRRLRHAAPAARRSRQRRLPLLLHAAQVRPGPGFRPRPGQVAEQRQPGVLRPVRPCPHLLGAGAMAGRRGALGKADLAPLRHEREFALCARLAEFPELVQQAARDYAPHALAFYLKDLAGDFHGWYNAERVLVDDAATRDARLALALATRQVLQNGLSLLGVSQPMSM
jgi:arginyl-tRNA synthetase